MLIREISEAVSGGASTWQEIGQLLERISEKDRDQVSLIGTILTPGQGRLIGLQHFQYRVERRLIGSTEIIAAGTGADDLMGMVPQIISSIPMPPRDFGAENFGWANQVGIGLAGALIGHESIAGRNILDWWGGAIEIASIVHDRFQKASNVLHTIWRVIKVENRRLEIRLVPKFLKYDYFQDVLIVQTLDVSVRDELQAAPTLHVNEHALRLYTPMLKSRRDYDFSSFVSPELSHQTLCCFILAEEEVPELGNHVRVYHSSLGDTPFQVAPSEQNPPDQEVMRISFHDKLRTDLERAI